jgi:hypothetical protein
VLPPRPGLGFLPEQVRQRVAHRIERRDRRQPHCPAAGLERAADIVVDQREDHQARILRDLLEDAFEMRFAAHHRPEMPERLDVVELRQRRLGDILQRLAGGVREKVEMEPHQAVRESVENITDSR